MSEPKVVHEFSSYPPLKGLLRVDEQQEQLWYRPLTSEWWEPLQDDRDIPQFVVAICKELARLAARVPELESYRRTPNEIQDAFARAEEREIVALSRLDEVKQENTRLREALGNAPEALFKMPFQMKREVAIEALRDYVDAALEEKQ